MTSDAAILAASTAAVPAAENTQIHEARPGVPLSGMASPRAGEPTPQRLACGERRPEAPAAHSHTRCNPPALSVRQTRYEYRPARSADLATMSLTVAAM